MRLQEHLEKKEIINESYKTAFVEDKTLWTLVKKYWPKEAKQLEKAYDEKTMDKLKDYVMGSISRYGLK